MSIPTTYDIEHSCGHNEVRDLSSVPAGQRAGKVAWLSSTKCFDCFKATSRRKVSKEVAAERQALHQEALDDQQRSELPILRGSDKQVRWAIDCRFALLRDGYTALVEERGLGDDAFDEQVLDPARRIDVAKWWIDNRAATSDTLIELLGDPGIVDSVENENPF